MVKCIISKAAVPMSSVKTVKEETSGEGPSNQEQSKCYRKTGLYAQSVSATTL